MEKKSIHFVVASILSIMLVLAFGYLILGSILLPKDEWSTGLECRVHTEPIYQIHKYGSRKEVKVPGKCAQKRGELVTLVTRIPDDMKDGSCLCFRSGKQEMHFYIDGELRGEYHPKENSIFGKANPVSYTFIAVDSGDAGKELTYTTKTDTSYSGIVYAIYEGNEMGIFYYFIQQYSAEVVLAAVLLVLSLLAFIISLIISVIEKNQIDLVYLSAGIFIAGMWEMTNSEFRQFLFPNISVVSDMAFMMLMLLSTCFLQYTNCIQKGRYKRIIGVVEICCLATFIPCILLHCLRIVDFADSVVYIDALCVVAIACMMLTFILDAIRGHIAEYRFVAIGMLCAFLTAIIQIISYYVRRILFTGLVFEFGLLLLLFFATINTIRNVLEIRKDRQKAVMANAAKDKFLASMSHEIRTPINAILGLDTMILRESQEAETKQYALDIQNAGQALLSLVNDILDLSKIESGKMEIVETEYDFGGLIHDVMNMVSERARNKGLDLELELDESLPKELYGDDVRIRQILVNILNNAVKYTPEGKVTLSVSGELSIQEDAKAWVNLYFRIADTGIGIKEEDMDRLFSAFERIDQVKNRNVEGTGLGMNITAELLSMMNTQLEVESEYGKGSVFAFHLMQRVESAAPIGDLQLRIKEQSESYVYEAAFEAPDATVLVVDDNEMNRKVFKSLLKDTKMNIDTAEDGYDCLEKVAEKHYDIIFLDHLMPGIDGCETLHRMKTLPRNLCENTPVIALTANAIAGAREMYLEEGFDEYLSKPVDVDKIEVLLQRFLTPEKLEKPQGGIEQAKKQETVKTPTFDRQKATQVENAAEELPAIAGVQWDYALLHLKDVELLKDSVQGLLSHGKMELRDLEQYYDAFSQVSQEEYRQKPTLYNEVIDQYRIQVHAMKSNAALIGAIEVSELAKLLEMAASQRRVDRIQLEMPLFQEKWNGLMKALEPMSEQGQKKPYQEGEVSEFIGLLSFAIEECNVDVMDMVVEELKAYELPEDRKDILEELEAAIFSLEYGKAKELVTKIAGVS